MWWNRLTVAKKVALLQWALPAFIILFVVLYQTFFVDFIHNWLGQEGHYMVEISFYGVMGPLATFFVLAWIRRWLREKDAMEQKVREQGKRLALVRLEQGKRVAQHLHREVLPNLAYVHTKLDHTQGQLLAKKMDAAQAAGQMTGIMTALRETIGELRERINALRKGLPFQTLPEGASLRQELERRAQAFRDLLQLNVNVSVKGSERRLSYQVASAIWRVAGEGLNNIALHARASRTELTLAIGEQDRAEKNRALLTLRDDGIGFEVQPKLTNPSGLGLIHMSDEVERLGGSLTITSKPGQGTVIEADFPLAQAEAGS